VLGLGMRQGSRAPTREDFRLGLGRGKNARRHTYLGHKIVRHTILARLDIVIHLEQPMKE
jgi:hypothetical protein